MPVNKPKQQKASIIKDCFMLNVEMVLDAEQYLEFKAMFPTLTESITYEQALALRVMKIGLTGNDKDSIAAFVHLNNRAYGLPKAEVETTGRLIQVEPLQSSEVVEIGKHFDDNY